MKDGVPIFDSYGPKCEQLASAYLYSHTHASNPGKMNKAHNRAHRGRRHYR